MKTSAQPTSDRSLSNLVKKCQELCGSADSALPKLDEEDSFLAANLADALEQLEVILRALGQGQESEGQQKSFFQRLFGRPSASAEEGEETPLDLPQQGLQGNSWTITLSELIGFLAFGRKTGVLWVDSPGENFLVGLAEGKVTHAASDATPEGLRLGEILVGFGFLTRRQLERFLEQRGGDEDPVAGADLLHSGMISEDELQSALVYQIRQLFQRLLDTKNAVFRFREGMQVPLVHQVELDVNQLLLESACAADEAGSRAAQDHEEWDSLGDELATEPGSADVEEEAKATEDGSGDPDATTPEDAEAGETDAEGEGLARDPESGKIRRRVRRKHRR